MATLRPRKGFGLGVLPRVPTAWEKDGKRWADDLVRTLDRGIQPETRIISVTIDPAAVAANTTAEQTFTVLTLQLGDFVAASKPTVTAGIHVGSSRVSAADTLAIQFANLTGAPIDPPSEAYRVLVVPGNPTS